jgi:anti-anti-sigma factor
VIPFASFLSLGVFKTMASNDPFRCEIAKAPDDDQGNKVTRVKCYGRLVGDASGRLKDTVKPLILNGGRIIIDLGDVDHLDSSAIGALVGLKVSAINHGYCILELDNLTPRVIELLRLTNLTQMFSK